MVRRETFIALWVRLGAHAKPTRTSTMIALRARRQALEIARDIAYPHVDVDPPVKPAPAEQDGSRTHRSLWPGIRLAGDDFVRESHPLPRWIEWLVAGWVIGAVVTAVLFISTF